MIGSQDEQALGYLVDSHKLSPACAAFRSIHVPSSIGLQWHGDQHHHDHVAPREVVHGSRN